MTDQEFQAGLDNLANCLNPNKLPSENDAPLSVRAMASAFSHMVDMPNDAHIEHLKENPLDEGVSDREAYVKGINLTLSYAEADIIKEVSQEVANRFKTGVRDSLLKHFSEITGRVNFNYSPNHWFFNGFVSAKIYIMTGLLNCD